MYKLLVIISVFLLGLYFIYQSNNVYSKNIEMFTTNTDATGNIVEGLAERAGIPPNKMTENCPDVLIQKGSTLFLYNSKRANVPGVNPIRFENLEEYIEFTEWQRSQGILCPILFLQHAYNAQGEPVYKARPSPTNLQGGLPDFYVNQPILGNMTNANTHIMPPPAPIPVRGFTGNVNNIGSFVKEDDSGHYPAFNSLQKPIDTPLDNLYNNTVSPNAMDSNWGGVDYTEKLVQAGYFKDNEVTK
jgi:hypothetical protein